jgi:SAM-dependent methyltransferase
VGHWGRVLSRVLPESATIVGIDREPLWIEKATEWAAAAGKRWRFDYRLASADSLPFPDGSFDLVTCQTVLIHVPDPVAVLREMVRVVRPGGLILAAEPTNITWSVLPSVALGETADQTVAMLHFQLVCERGKQALGEGSNLLGEAVPQLFAQAGLEDIEVRQNDRPWSLVPPYQSVFEQAQVDEGLDMAERRLWIADEPTTRRYFLAGGGSPEDFAPRWNAAMAQNQRWVQAIRQHRYALAGGGLHYLVFGRRPA